MSTYKEDAAFDMKAEADKAESLFAISDTYARGVNATNAIDNQTLILSAMFHMLKAIYIAIGELK